MNRRRLAFGATSVALWIVMIHLGALLFETVVVYPNIFHDVPASLELSMEWMAATAPHDFFAPVGALSIVAIGTAIAASWRFTTVRNWLLIGLVVAILGEFVLSATVFWPRNTIMFSEGLTVHSAETLKTTAKTFQRLHWLRVGATVVNAAAVFRATVTLAQKTPS